METISTPPGALSTFLATFAPNAIDRWSALHLDEDGDFIETAEPINEPTEADLTARQVRQDMEGRKSAFYTAMERANLHPSPHLHWVLDNLTNPFVNRVAVCAEFARFEAELAAKHPSIAAGPYMERLRDRLKKFVLPEYLWDGILVKRCCYSLTAQTGAGKTAFGMLVAIHTAIGQALCGRNIERGSVLYFAGENPTDVDMRWLGAFHLMGLDPDDLDIHTIAGTMDISAHAEQIRVECLTRSIEPALIVVDTAAAYFPGDDDNHNVQMGNYARQLRELCKLPGEPCVLILAHPTKGAKEVGEMVPRGGGAFINEMDGNLGAARDGNMVGIQAVGKFRGPEFTPLHFGLHTVRDCPALFDPEKRTFMPTVVAQAVSEAGAAARKMERETDDIRLVRFIDKNPKASFAQIATEFRTNKSRAERMVNSLITEKLIKRDKLTGKLTLSSTAQMSLNELESEPSRSEAVMVPFPGIPGPRIA